MIHLTPVSLKESGLLSLLLPTSCELESGWGTAEWASTRQRMVTPQGMAELWDRELSPRRSCEAQLLILPRALISDPTWERH